MCPASAVEPSEPPRPGRVARAAAWTGGKAQGATRWAIGAREDHASVDVGFRFADRDQRVAASVLAGGVAYRLFFWFLSFSVLANAGLGFTDGHRAEKVLTDLGVPSAVTQAVTDASQQTDQARFWVLLVGAWLVLLTGYTGAKAMVLVHATVWGVDPPPIRKPWWVSLGFAGVMLAFGVSLVLVQWARSESHTYGLLVTLLSGAVPFAFWLVVSSWLPRRGTGWRGLVPGAVLVAVGVHAMYLFTTWFLQPKLDSATEKYGLLGVVATALFWLYIFGRLVIGGAALNASLHDHLNERAGPAES